ncbi:unnamed protein product [Echinostoma caproni]|uniref:BHLH domain-containing protein n=1 Tax=Echinostoma caproni TaxID=27848 RepID=A0A183A8W1_9TREM|nr:unnamed protein product [Echinostoma caproni]
MEPKMQPRCSRAITNSRVLVKTKGIRSRKLRWIECARLKEIVPSVAKSKRVNEVKIIKEAIKHISRLEEAVLQRLGTSLPGNGTPDINGKSIMDLLPRHIFLTIAAQANVQLPNLSTDLVSSRTSTDLLPATRTNRDCPPIPDSTGNSPCWTDEDSRVEWDMTES